MKIELSLQGQENILNGLRDMMMDMSGKYSDEEKQTFEDLYHQVSIDYLEQRWEMASTAGYAEDIEDAQEELIKDTQDNHPLMLPTLSRIIGEGIIKVLGH